MDRATIFSTLTLLSACATTSYAATTTPRPNILWLTYEDTSPEYIGCYGNDRAKTPTMDALAEDGVLFTRAFSTGTVSSASRFCLITGCRTTKYGTGNHRSAYCIPDFVHGFPEYLRKAGYYTSNNYKTDYNHYDHKRMTQDSWNESSGKATWRKREAGQPFFSVFNSPHSHQSRTMTNPWSVYENQVLKYLDPARKSEVDGDFPIPPYYRESPEMRKQCSRIYNSISLTDQQFEGILNDLDRDGLRDSTIIFCFSDHGEGMPRAKGSALGSGHRVPFILWIPEMYKDLTPWGSGVVTDELVSFEDFGATVLSLAGVEIPSYNEGVPFLPKENLRRRSSKKKYVFGHCDAVDNNIEFARTVTDGHYMYSRIFTPYQPFVRWTPYYDHSRIQKIMRQDLSDGVLNELQRDILEPREMEYLYDIEGDKWECVNLAKDPKYKGVVKRMRGALMEYLKETRDAHFMPEYTRIENHLKETAYDLRLDDDYYPFDRILESASLIGLGAEAIDEQVKALNDENDFVSYWAAIALFTQREALGAKVDRVKESLSNLSYPPAKVWAAAAILNVEEYEPARKVLEDAILGENDQLATTTFNALLEMRMDVAKSFIPTFREMDSRPELMKRRPSASSHYLVVRQRIEGVEFRYGQYW